MRKCIVPSCMFTFARGSRTYKLPETHPNITCRHPSFICFLVGWVTLLESTFKVFFRVRQKDRLIWVYIYIYIYTQTQTRTHTHTHTLTLTHTHVYIYMCVCVCVCVCVSVWTKIGEHLFLQSFLFVFCDRGRVQIVFCHAIQTIVAFSVWCHVLETFFFFHSWINHFLLFTVRIKIKTH